MERSKIININIYGHLWHNLCFFSLAAHFYLLSYLFVNNNLFLRIAILCDDFYVSSTMIFEKIAVIRKELIKLCQKI